MSAPRTSRLRCSIASGTETSNPAHSRKHCCLSCGDVSSHPPFLFHYKTVLLKTKNTHRLSVFLASDTVLPVYVHVCCFNGYVCVCRSNCPSTHTCHRSSSAPPPSTPPSAVSAPSCSWCTLSSITTGPSIHWSAAGSPPKVSVRSRQEHI